MTVDEALSARVEAWIDSADHIGEETRAMVDAVLAAGFAPQRIHVVVDRAATVDTSEAVAIADSAGVHVLDADPASLDRRVAATDVDFVFVVRRGSVVADVIPKVVGFADRFPAIDIVYGDSSTELAHPLLRPAFSPIRLRSNDYLGPVVAVRASVLRRLGGFRADARHSQVLDLILRAHEAGRVIELLPDNLATEDLDQDDLPGTSDAQRRVVAAHFERIGVDATIEDVEPFVRRIRYGIAGEPLVSIIVPTRGSAAEIAGRDRVLVVEALRGIVERSTYTNLEFVVVADAETPSSVVEELEAVCGDRLRLVAWDAPFNFSAKMNRGAAASRGEYLLLLNDDVEMVTDDWIETMLGLAQQEGVGIVGAQLYFEDSTVQHGGQVYTGGVAGHAAFGWTGGRDDSIKSMLVAHEVSGVTAACALLRRDVYLEVGGFTLALPGNYNDVDLNMKIRSTGRSAVFTPWARLYHFESKTRDPKILDTDLETLQARWSRRMQVELYSRML
jgi:Glycosyl transferase family 2